MRTKYNKRRFRTLIMIIILLLCMSIGYSYLLTTLNIEGTSNIKANTWDVHWENVSIKSGSVTGDQVPIAAHILTDTTQVEYSVIIKNPGDFYEFTVDAKNSGSLDAMVSVTDTKFYESNGVTQISLPNYLEYSFTYEDGDVVEQNHLLEANSSETYKVILKFKDNLEESQLPTTDKTIVIRQSVTYIQADENATPSRIYGYSFPDGRISMSELESNLSGLYPTPEESITESGYPTYLKCSIKNGTANTLGVGFKYNGNNYYLRGGIDEYYADQTPVYNENKMILTNAFDSANCHDYGTVFGCLDNNYNAEVRTSGEVTVSVKNLEGGYTGCLITADDIGYYAYCGRISS